MDPKNGPDHLPGGHMFLGSLIGSPGPAHTRPASSLPCPGRLAMIVTEYMENGSLDAFLRVCLPTWGKGARP